jgi:hypothetical protein
MPPFSVRLVRLSDSLQCLGFRLWFEGLQDFASSGIDAFDGHDIGILEIGKM